MSLPYLPVDSLLLFYFFFVWSLLLMSWLNCKSQGLLDIREEGAWTVHEMLNLEWKLLLLDNWFTRGMWGLAVVLLGLESIDDKLRVWRRVVEWIVCHSDYKDLHQALLSAIHQFSESEIKNQWMWVLLPLPMLWEGRERLQQCQPSQISFPHWVLDTAWIG